MRSDHPLFRLFLAIVLNIALALPAFAAFTDNGDGTVTDTKTGLIWMRCTIGQTWNGATCTGTATTYTWARATVLTQTYAGHSDWRLPKVRELQSIVDYSKFDPAIDGSTFPATPIDHFFWSASHRLIFSTTDDAWIVDFRGGATFSGYSPDSGHVRLVRNGQSSALFDDARPTSDYIDNRDGTVTHTPTGLTWMRCALGQTWSGSFCTGVANTYSWDQAMAQKSSQSGYSDWRLPSIEELNSLVDYSARSWATINQVVFPNLPGDWFWSASTYADVSFPGFAWYLDHGDGCGVNPVDDSHNRVRLVRAGQSIGSFALSVSATGAGSGEIAGTGISCGSTRGATFGTCSASLASGTTVTLIATSNSNSTFAGWSGCDSVSGASCFVQMNMPKSVMASFNRSIASQFITFGVAPSIAVGGTGAVSAWASSGLAVVFSSLTPGVCSVSGSTVTVFAAGVCTIAANQAGDSSTSAAPQTTQSFSIGKNSQTISFVAIPSSLLVGGTGIVSATASSGLTVAFSSLTTGVCTVSGNAVSGLAVGTCTIAANQDGNGSTGAAPQVTQSFAVSAPLATATEYYHAGFGHYFVTGAADEAAAIDSGAIKGWARTGQTYSVYSQGGTGLSPVCRFFSTSFSPKSSHFYTPSAAECGSLKTNRDWQFEANAFYVREPAGGACASGTVPLYRIYNNGHSGAPNHRYTTCVDLFARMIARGWVSEGVAMCVPGGSTNCATDHSGGGVDYNAPPATTPPTMPAITPPPGTVGVAYSVTYSATGSAPISFSAIGLPPGLSMSSSGIISGTPTQAGTYTGIVTASNGTAPSATQSFTIVINNAAPSGTIGVSMRAITFPTSGTVGVAYSAAFSATGSPPISFSAIGLPPGLSMSSSGLISGTPTLAGTYNGIITARNGTSSATQGFTIVIQAKPGGGCTGGGDSC